MEGRREMKTDGDLVNDDAAINNIYFESSNNCMLNSVFTFAISLRSFFDLNIISSFPSTIRNIASQFFRRDYLLWWFDPEYSINSLFIFLSSLNLSEYAAGHVISWSFLKIFEHFFESMQSSFKGDKASQFPEMKVITFSFSNSTYFHNRR